MKKLVTTLLLIFMVIALAQPAFAAEIAQIQPYYADAGDIEVSLTISNNGTATIRATCMGDSNVTSVNLTVYLQKKVGTSWVTVSGCTWSATNLSRCFSKSYSASVSGSGEYRAVGYFYITATSTSTESATSYASY